jgi:hypothetical protein
MSSGQPAEQKQETQYVLSPEQRELMGLAMPGIREFAAKVPERYGSSTVAGFDPSQVAGQQGALGSAGVQTGLARSGAGTSNAWLDPAKLDVSNDPIVQANIASAQRPVWDQLMEVALPGVRDSAERTGNFGSSRQGIAEGVAVGKATKAAGDIASGITSKAYDTNVDAQLKALGLLPQTSAVQTGGDATTSAVGDVRQALEQARLNETVGNFNYDQLAPFLQSKEIMAMLSGIPGGSTVSTASGPTRNPLTSALGGAASGAALGSAIMPGIGTGVGAGIGGLLAFL